MSKITAIIPTFNEETNIRAAIESCLFADEIIVVDSYSTDKTLGIIADFNQVKLIQRIFDTHAKQKNWAIDQAQHEWIFVLDADERTNPELISEIKNTISTNPEQSAFWINRRNIFMEKELNFTWKNDAVIRLFKKSNSRYPELNVHEEIETKGTVGKLGNKLLHNTYQDKGWDFHIQKGHRYTTLSAIDKIDRTGSVNYYHLLIKPLATFLKHFVLKGGIFDGKQGYIIASLSAWNVFERYVKIWRMRKGEKF